MADSAAAEAPEAPTEEAAVAEEEAAVAEPSEAVPTATDAAAVKAPEAAPAEEDANALATSLTAAATARLLHRQEQIASALEEKRDDAAHLITSALRARRFKKLLNNNDLIAADPGLKVVPCVLSAASSPPHFPHVACSAPLHNARYLPALS